MGNLQEIFRAAGHASRSSSYSRSNWMNPDFSFLDDPAKIRREIDLYAPVLQAGAFTTEDLLLDWFPVLEKCWVVSRRQQHHLNMALFDAGYFPVGAGLSPTWYWAQNRLVRV